jgi:alpha-glucosidase
MPWSSARYGGFTSGEPWLPTTGEIRDVERQRTDPDSCLLLYGALLRLRRAEPALSVGGYVPVRHSDSVLVYDRCYRDRRLRIALNMTDRAQPMPFDVPVARLLISTRPGQPESGELRPSEGLVALVQS